jgi:hypothetical protein
VRVVDGLLGLGFPGCVSGRVIGDQADNVNLAQIFERGVFEVGQFTAEDEMKQLLLRGMA